ncbi:hypothetical protein [Coralloluteibacterium thermophilus]|uniref:DNA-binding protein n=1 Tax=Coralloluteibacterium thermophilum TaxID=2707049 RepID=A0ABV9NIK0_9GAMM
MRCTRSILAALVLAATAAGAGAQEMIPPEHASRFIGKNGMVCGKVERARFAQNSEGEPTFLYMGGAFPRHTFSARIPGSERAKFNPAPESLEGQDICVVGNIRRDASRAEIVVTGPADVKLATIR